MVKADVADSGIKILLKIHRGTHYPRHIRILNIKKSLVKKTIKIKF